MTECHQSWPLMAHILYCAIGYLNAVAQLVPHGHWLCPLETYARLRQPKSSKRLQLWGSIQDNEKSLGKYLTPCAYAALQSCPTLCDPIDGSPPGSPVPGILQARTLEWVAISFSNEWKWEVKVKSFSCVWLFVQPTRLLRPWDLPGKSTGVGRHCLLLMQH